MTEELRWNRGGDEDAAQKPQELQVCLRRRGHLQKNSHKEKVGLILTVNRLRIKIKS